MSQRILIIDDDERLGDMLQRYLQARGYGVEVRHDGASGVRAARHGQFDALVLDVMLPDTDGFEVCRQVRAESALPIVMLTARGDETDRIVGLELGADDYLPKPFNPRELLARLRAVLRRAQAASEPEGASELLRFDYLEVDLARRQARVDGVPCDLTSHQFALLHALASRRGRVLSREQLMRAARGEVPSMDAFDRSIDVHISRIRAAVERDPKKPRLIRTVRSVGYVFTGEAQNAGNAGPGAS